MGNKSIAGLVIVISCLFLLGCETIQRVDSGRQWDDSLLFLIEDGKTTAKDIAYSFGPPQKEIAGATGRVWIYYKTTYKYFSMDGYVTRLAESEEYSLSIWFNKDGIVSSHALSYNHYLNPETSEKEALKNQPSEQTQDTGGTPQ